MKEESTTRPLAGGVTRECTLETMADLVKLVKPKPMEGIVMIPHGDKWDVYALDVRVCEALVGIDQQPYLRQKGRA